METPVKKRKQRAKGSYTTKCKFFELSATGKRGYNMWVNPITRAMGKDKCWEQYAAELMNASRPIRLSFGRGWNLAEKKKATEYVGEMQEK